MKDFSTRPDFLPRPMREGYVVVNDAVHHVQGFYPEDYDAQHRPHPNGRLGDAGMLWCPEIGYSVSESNFYTDEEVAVAKLRKSLATQARYYLDAIDALDQR